MDDSNRSRPRLSSPALFLICAAAACVVYLLMNHVMVSDLIYKSDEREVYKSLVYAAWLACGFAVLFGLAISGPTPSLYVVLPVLLVSITINYSYRVISKRA